MGFHVAIGEADSAGAIVPGCWPVDPLGGLHAEAEVAIIQAGFVLLEQNGGQGRSRGDEVGVAAVGSPAAVAGVSVGVVEPGSVHRELGAECGIGSHGAVHGDCACGADACAFVGAVGAGVGAALDYGGALKGFGVEIQIHGEQGKSWVGQNIRIELLRPARTGLAGDPIESGIGIAIVGVWGEEAVIVAGVHLAGEEEASLVVCAAGGGCGAAREVGEGELVPEQETGAGCDDAGFEAGEGCGGVAGDGVRFHGVRPFRMTIDLG